MKKWQFWIDVGGTFTDCIARSPDGVHYQHKTLSSGVVKGVIGSGSRPAVIIDQRRANDPEGIWCGYSIRVNGSHTTHIQQFTPGKLHLETIAFGERSACGGVYELSGPESAPLLAIRYVTGIALDAPLPPMDIRLGTTRGTNALLTRTGSRTAFLTTRGFRDVLSIGYQTRPDLFALAIETPTPLYEHVLELDERTSTSGAILKAIDVDEVRSQLVQLRASGIESLAVALLHACANPEHECIIDRIAGELGFTNVSLSHATTSLRKFVPRGDTTVIDAYLTPVLQQYVAEFETALHPDSRLELMTSSGGLAHASKFRGKDSILSGPAGGVVAVARVAQQVGFSSAIGFDMGGTSTDVSRWAGRFDLEYETEKVGTRMATPMVAIETIAAGGGSICSFDGIKLTVGPASAGAEPGPACYGSGGPLALTDINCFLGKLSSSAFPFGLDRTAVEELLDNQCIDIYKSTGKLYSTIELADGYLKIANASMAEAIRSVSTARGADPRKDVLVAFGGAAAQHACAIADELGMENILLHPNAGIMSAFGIGLAKVTVHRESGIYRPLEEITSKLDEVFRPLSDSAHEDLQAKLPIEWTRSLDLRFSGLDTPLRIQEPADGDFQAAYEEEFLSRSGYLPTDRKIEVVAARVTATQGESTAEESHRLPNTRAAKHRMSQLAYFDTLATSTKYFVRTELSPGDIVFGPALIAESISTIVVDPHWQAETLTCGSLLLTKRTIKEGAADRKSYDTSTADPILLEVFNNRFAAIASQMGSTLRNNARSVNVKERLDFSCAVFTSSGELVVNAPHIPVHLGAMGATVKHCLKTMSFHPGDAVVTNDPYHGGSHLPDVTVITPIHDARGTLLFLTASRAHHAEIGGITPGSMPAFSTNLGEEGVLIRAMKVVDSGQPAFEVLRSLLSDGRYPSRDVATNIADIQAQIAANRHGADSLLRFVDEYSWNIVQRYMKFIQAAAEQKTRSALARLPDGTKRFTDYLDNGSPITATISIASDSARIDFTGTGEVLPGNLNANRAIVTASTLYCLRLLVNEDIPLNEGVLAPIEIVLPPCLLNPKAHEDVSRCPAIVGGNVETSQRIVDVLLGALGIAAASQGTMNNFLFGDETFGYYETICGGSGAVADADGCDAVHSHMTNTRLTDPEVLEARFPVRLRCFSIRGDSGGSGRFRGGNGVVREIEFLSSLEVSLLTQRRGEFAPFGIDGGGDGQRGINRLQRVDGKVEELASLASISVSAGDILRIETPGGGGWGNVE